jgi:signal peptidase II
MALANGSPLARFGAVVLLVILDQWSKAAIYRPPPAHRPLLGTTWLSFSGSCNAGAAFGQLSQFPWLLVVGRSLAVVFLGWLLLRAASRPRLVLSAMTLVLSGALGNLIDNLWTGCTEVVSPFRGVRDFIDVYFGPLGIDWRFPAFNVADSCITVGACAWILAGFLHKGADQPSATTAPGQPGRAEP